MEGSYTEVKMTLFVSLDTRRWLKEAARKANTNSSAYIRSLIQEAMRQDLNRKDKTHGYDGTRP